MPTTDEGDLRYALFDFFIDAADDGEMTRFEAIERVKLMLGLIVVEAVEGQHELFDVNAKPSDGAGSAF